MGETWYLIVVLICIPPVANEVKHLFRGLLAICVPCLEKCLFKFFVCFLIEFCFFSPLSCKSSLYTLDTQPLLLDLLIPNIREHVDSTPTGTLILAEE